MPLFDFVSRLELSSLDTRFQLRGRTPTDPRIIIVDVDQAIAGSAGSLALPAHPFRASAGRLREDGARVVAFDMTFSKPDETALPLQDLSRDLAAAAEKGTCHRSAPILSAIEVKEEQYNYDQQVAQRSNDSATWLSAIIFCTPRRTSQGSPASRWTNTQIRCPGSLSRRYGLCHRAGGVAGRVRVIEKYEDLKLVPRGVEANAAIFTDAVRGDKKGCRIFQRRTGSRRRGAHACRWRIPYGRSSEIALTGTFTLRSKCRRCACISGSPTRTDDSRIMEAAGLSAWNLDRISMCVPDRHRPR